MLAIALIERLRGGVIVSCQAPPHSPLRHPDAMADFARAAEAAGAVGIRAQGADDIRAIRTAVALPIIGICKRRSGDSEVFITPAPTDVHTLVDAGADLVAADLTPRRRTNNRKPEEILAACRQLGVPLMADLRDIRDAHFALALGADIIAPTLATHQIASNGEIKRDLELLARFIEVAGDRPVIAEGGYSRPKYARRAIGLGAHSVVVGRAITDPLALTEDFVAAARSGGGAPFGS